LYYVWNDFTLTIQTSMQKMYFLLILLLSPLGVFASSVDVTANPPSGTYQSPVYITLTPTDSQAKTFYSFKPDGYPQDAFLYTKPILLKNSSPFIYFSIINTTNESKIKQNNYIIEYSSFIRFESESVSGSGKVNITLINSGSESVNIGFWQVQSESDRKVIPEGTMIAPWAKQSVNLNYTGNSSIVLRSPDNEEKDILIPSHTENILPKKQSITTKIVPRKIISTAETTAPVIENITVPAIISPTSGTSVIQESAPLDINQIVKASAQESGQKGTNPLYLVVILAISLGGGTVQWYLRNRNK